MLQSVGIEFGLNSGYNPLRRRNRHLSFISGTADHFSWRKLDDYPDYRPSYLVHPNREEIRAIRQADEPEWYAHYTPGPVYYPADDQPLLTAQCLPRVEEEIRGRSVTFKIFGKRKTLWLWERRYHTLKNSSSRHGADYLYGSVLNCAAPVRDCDPSVSVPSVTDVRRFVAAGHPNPFVGELTIDFELPQAGPVTISIHDVSGRLVRRLLEGSMPAGKHSVRWNGTDDAFSDVPPGLYLWKLQAGGQQIVRRAFMVK
jgi:hypothetical protein